MLKFVRLFVTLLLGGLVAAGVWKVWREPAAVTQSKGAGKRGGGASGDGPVPVRAVAAITADVPVTLDAVGTARALNTVSVQPQTGGKIIKVSFKEGQNVDKGQVLAEIDPAPLQATLDQALAKQRQDAAQLANARMDLGRYNRIPGTLPQKTVDTQRSLVTQFEGLAASNKAAGHLAARWSATSWKPRAHASATSSRSTRCGCFDRAVKPGSTHPPASRSKPGNCPNCKPCW